VRDRGGGGDAGRRRARMTRDGIAASSESVGAAGSNPSTSIWRDPFLCVALLAALLYRVLLLATIDAHAHYDEAIVGVMARHILEKGERPLFFYGQNYGGGGAIEAYAAAALFALFGERTVLLKALPLVLSLLAIPATYAVARRVAGPLGARLALLLFLTAPPTLEWSLAARGGYVETMLASALLVLLVLPALEGAPMARRRWILIGLLAGFGFYVFGLIAPAALTVAVFAVAARPGLRRALPPALAGLALGAAPILYDNVAHGFVNIRHLVMTAPTAGLGEAAARFLRHFAGLASHDLPAFFTPWIDDFVQVIPGDAWVYAGALAALCLAHAIATRGDWALWARRARDPRAHAAPGPALVPLVFVAIYLAAYVASRFAGQTPRYLLGLYPLIAVLAAAGAARLLAGGSRPLRALAALAVALLAGIGVARAALLPRPAELREYAVVSRGDSAARLLEFLRREKIRIVFATPPIKWKVLWEGRGEVLAATWFFPQEDWYRYPDFERDAVDRAVWQGEPAAIVTHARFGYETFRVSLVLPSLLGSRALWEGALAQRGITYRCDPVGEYLVYHAFSKNVPAFLRARELTADARKLIETGQDLATARLYLDRARSLDPEDPEIMRLLLETQP